MEEYVDVVDEDDKVISVIKRADAKKSGILHRIAIIIVINDQGKFLLQKRSMSKDTYPGLWDLSCAETVTSNESYEEAASRGMREELGLSYFPKEIENSFLFNFKYRSPTNNINYRFYKCVCNSKMILQKEEIDEALFHTQEEVNKLISEDKFHPAAAKIFQKYIQTVSTK